MREAYQGRLKCACQKQAEESSDVEQNYLHVCNCPGLYVPASGYHTAQSIRYSIQFIPDTILKAPSQKFCSCKSISVQVYLPLTSILNLLTLAVPYTPRLGLSSSCQQSSNTTKPLLPSRLTILASALLAKQCSLLAAAVGSREGRRLPVRSPPRVCLFLQGQPLSATIVVYLICLNV